MQSAVQGCIIRENSNGYQKSCNIMRFSPSHNAMI